MKDRTTLILVGGESIQPPLSSVTTGFVVCLSSSCSPSTSPDLPWYVSVLVDLSYVQGPLHGPKVAAQLIDVSVRAESVRAYAVKCMLGLLLDANLFLGQSQTTISNVLYAAGWLVGEYAEYLDNSDGGHRVGGWVQ